MTYPEYFQQADFSMVWACLRGFYKEAPETEPLYEAVFNEVRTMPVDSAHSNERIEIVVSHDREVKVLREFARSPRHFMTPMY